MAINARPSFAARARAGALIIPFFEGKQPAFEAGDLTALCGHPLESGDFSGKAEEVIVHYSGSAEDARVVLLGLGKQETLTAEGVRRGYGKALSAIKAKAKTVNVQLPVEKDVGAPCIEGVLLAAYTFDSNTSKKEETLEDITFLGIDPEALKEVEALCKSVAFTRDLVFQNADVVTPTFLAQTAKEFASCHERVKTHIMDRKQIKEAGLGLLEAVSRAATQEPAFIVIEYTGNPESQDQTALIGKGITYDTGGLSLKPTSGMLTMRDDMGGAGAVLGTIHALCHLELPVNVVAVIASTENSIGPSSYKVGDVYTGYCGKTVEVTNTDAEGRLVLADALSYVEANYQPSRIIDLATLTGGAIVALGEESAALMSNSCALAGDLERASEQTDERLWRLPLYEDYKELLSSKVADIKNSGDRKASPIQGGVFLQHFVNPKTAWAHIDIAGVAFVDSPKSYQPIQATGYGVRLLTRFFQTLCQ